MKPFALALGASILAVSCTGGFSDAVAQVADARVFAGFHCRFSCNDAFSLGATVAN